MTAPIGNDRILAVFTRTRAVLTAADVAALLADGRTGNEIGYRLKMMAASGELVATGKIAAKGRATGYRAASVAPGDAKPWTGCVKRPEEAGHAVTEVDIGDDATGYTAFVARLRPGRWIGLRGTVARAKDDARVFGSAEAAWAALGAWK